MLETAFFSILVSTLASHGGDFELVVRIGAGRVGPVTHDAQLTQKSLVNKELSVGQRVKFA